MIQFHTNSSAIDFAGPEFRMSIAIVVVNANQHQITVSNIGSLTLQ